jgi:hypothetical protein
MDGKVKSIEKSQKTREPAALARAVNRQPDANAPLQAFGASSVSQMAGNLAVQQLFRTGGIQAKLAISQPGDPDEEEADHVADQVMRMAEPATISSAPSTIQRKCATCEAGGATCPKCEEEEKIRRKEKPGNAPQTTPAIHSQIDALRGKGHGLPPSVRSFFEPRFGRDFSDVRVHTDSSAVESALAIQARAFTSGHDVVFGAGEYSPESPQGRQLLAHELTHVLQQRGPYVTTGVEAQGQTGPALVNGDSPAKIQRVPAEYDMAKQKKLIEEGIREKEIGKIKDVEPSAYVLANDSQAIDLILILLNQGWVGPRDEKAIYDIWKSRGKGIIALASKFTFVWNMCLSRGVDMIWTIPDLNPVKTEFKQAIASRARGYLDANKKTVDSERKRYGLNNMGAAPIPETGRQREKMLHAAGIVKKAKDAIVRMDRMLVGYKHVVGTPQNNNVEQCAALFNPTAPPPLPGHVPVPAAEGDVLPSWDDTRKNYERAHAVIDHYTRLYPVLVALREEMDLNTVARTGISSEEPAEKLTAMHVVNNALNDTMSNIDKTYPLLNDPKSEFALELQPIHEQFFLFDPTWQDPFRQIIARAAVKEHGNVEFWNTLGVNAAGLALFVVAEFTTGGLATFFFAAAAAGSIAQAAASWDKYFTLKAAAGTNLTEETTLISRDQASDQLLTASIDTIMAFVDLYTAAKGGTKALAELSEAETKLTGIVNKEARTVEEESKLARVDVGNGHDVRATDQGIQRCSPTCPLIGNFWERELERHPDVKPRLEQDAQLARTDPVWASRDAGAADRALQNLNELDIEQWAADIPSRGVSETPKFSEISRLPSHRADIANKVLTPEQVEFVEKNAAEMKAQGRLPAEYHYAPPSIPGAIIPRELAQSAMQIIGKKISENTAVAACWEKATADLHTLLSPENYAPLYKKAASRFWPIVGRDAAAKEYFVKQGFIVDGITAAHLDVQGIARQEFSLGLDHTLPKAMDDNWKHALDGDKIQFLMQADNTKLSHLEKKDPSLRR